MNLSYLMIGAGATGSCIGGYLSLAGKDVAMIARGSNLKAMKDKGLTIKKGDQVLFTQNIKLYTEDAFHGTADVIFVCVKSYSISNLIPLLKRVSHKNSVVIPILNIYGTGEKLSHQLSGVEILDGCIYIASELISPGVAAQKGDIFRIVFGRRDGITDMPILKQIEKDLSESRITPILSSNVKVDTYRKFSYVSAQNAVGLYYHANAGMIQTDSQMKQDFLACVGEIRELGLAMDVVLEPEIPEINYNILADLAPDMTTSMQKDIDAGRESEIDGLIFEVLRLGKKYHVSLPTYEKIAKTLRSFS